MSRGGDDDELAGIEVELARLQRQQRVAVGQRKQLTDQSENELRKQMIQLEKLKADNATFKEELRLARMDFDAEDSTKDYVEELRFRYAGYAREIDIEKERVAFYDKEIAEARRRLETDAVTLGKQHQSIRSAASYAHQIATLENRVEHALNQYDAQLTANSKLRETIDHLKKERNVFDGLKHRLETELLEQKKQMGEVIDRSNQAYEARDDAQARMIALRERSEKELQESTMELKELNRVLEQEAKLKDFMGIKGRDRARELELAAKARKEKGEAKEKPEDVINQYEAIFNQIKQTSGIQETSQLVDRFIETEDRNFSLFNLVNELNTNIELLKEQINRVESQISEYNQQSIAMDLERKETLKELELKLSTTSSQAETLQRTSSERSSELGTLVSGIAELFKQIDCDIEPIAEMLGEKEANERNIMQFLGIIEQRANELLLTKARVTFKAQRKWEKEADDLITQHADNIQGYDPVTELGEKPVVGGVLGDGPSTLALTKATVNDSKPMLHMTDDYDDEEEEDDDELLRPLTHSELKAKILRGSTTRPRASESSPKKASK